MEIKALQSSLALQILSFRENTILSDWEESYIINLFKGQGDAPARGNYRGLKLLDQVMKVLKRILEVFIREKVNINDMQFGFTTDVIFIVRQMQEKYIVKVFCIRRS